MASETPAGQKGKDQSRPVRYRAPPGRAAQAARDIDFPVVLRGYDRAAVDHYVEEVNRVIAELEISSSPASAVRHALEQVSEETAGLLQRAHETADEIAARSRAQADDRLQRAEREAEEVRTVAARDAEETRAAVVREVEAMRAEAEARVEELARNADAIAGARHSLIDDVSAIAQRLAQIADEERERFEAAPETTELPDDVGDAPEAKSDEPDADQSAN